MFLWAKQIVDKVLLDDQKNSADFIEFITDSMERKLISLLIKELADNQLYAVQLHEPILEPGFVEDLALAMPNQEVYRQALECNKLVQCKNCRMHFPWCYKFKSELGGNGFCPYGKEIEYE